MQTQDDGSHSHHVVDVGETDERDGDEMMHKHHQEVLSFNIYKLREHEGPVEGQLCEIVVIELS